MPYLSGAEVLVASLAKEGAEVIFGIPGVQIMDAVDAIYCEKKHPLDINPPRIDRRLHGLRLRPYYRKNRRGYGAARSRGA